jgi:N-terminal acetyltransferase B complex non-catalytic subunit
MLKKVDTIMKDLVPTSENMLMLWEQTLYLGSNPKDGGQKEALPGDDLILLASQLMIYSSRSEETIQKEKIIDATTVLLERARQNSPFNPYLKIASLHLYAQSDALVRTWEIFQSLGIKHIQFESCSYLILPYLIQHGMYEEAVQHAGKIINLHSSSSKDIENAICRSFENGNISKGQEMIDWQRHEMRQSLQLLEAKATVMNLAPFLKDSECSSPLGSIHGFCGNSDDFIRAQKILRDSTDIFAAPSLMKYSSIQVATRVLTKEFSDNRDLSVNDFEVLSRTEYPSKHCESIQCSHIQSILTRMVCLVKAAKAPKKGKVPKYSSGDTLEKRCHSLLSAINNADIFFKSNKCDGIYMKLRDVSLLLSRVTCILSTGIDAGKPSPDDDSMNSRENRCISLLGSARQLLIESEEQIDECNTKQSLLASAIVPLLSMLETTYNLFSIFGWSKRKRKTKAAMGALADTALSFHSFVLTLQGCTKNDTRLSELKSINSNADGVDGDRSKIVFTHVLQVLKSYDVEE